MWISSVLPAMSCKAFQRCSWALSSRCLCFTVVPYYCHSTFFSLSFFKIFTLNSVLLVFQTCIQQNHFKRSGQCTEKWELCFKELMYTYKKKTDWFSEFMVTKILPFKQAYLWVCLVEWLLWGCDGTIPTKQPYPDVSKTLILRVGMAKACLIPSGTQTTVCFNGKKI